MTLKKNFTKEVKIAISFIVALTLIVIGINFLKGINIFTPTNQYFLKFERVDGLVISNGVFIKGYKVGQVRDIEYDFSDKNTPFIVNFAINDDVKIPKGTTVYLFDESIMGGKGIDIRFGEENELYASGDTLPCSIDAGLLTSMGEIVPQLQQTMKNLDSLVVSVNTLVNSDDINKSLSNINSITTNLNHTTEHLNGIMKKDVPVIINKVNLLADNLNNVSTNINKVQLNDIANQVDSTLKNLNTFTTKLNNPNSSVGLLLNDDKLYNNLESTAKSANNLLIDLKENPKRYVHFSIWGRKEKK